MKIQKQTVTAQMTIFSATLIIVMLVQLFALSSDSLIFLLCCVLCSLLFSVSMSFNPNSRFYHPYVFILLATFIGVTLRGFYMVYQPDDERINEFFLRNQNPAYFDMPTFMLLTGMFAFVMAYRFTSGKLPLQRMPLFKMDYRWDQKKINWVTIIFFLIAAVGMFLFLRALGISNILADLSGKRFVQVTDTGSSAGAEYTSFGYYRLMISFIQPLLYIYLLNFILTGKKIFSGSAIVLFIIVLANLFFPVFTSSRSDLLTIFLNVFIIISLAGKLTVRLVAPMGILAILLFAVVTVLRPAKNDSVSTAQNTALLEPFIYNKNLLDVSKTAHIINNVPSKMQFQYGASFLALIYAPIPRQLWPNKPVLAMSKDIAQKIYGYNEKNMAGIPPGMAAEMYVNFGYAGILIGFFLAGILLKKAYNSFEFDEKGMNKNRVVLYVTIVVSITITLFGGSINQAILAILQSYIPLWIALRFITDFKKTDNV